MQSIDANAVMTVAVPAIGVIIWLLRLEGRVNTSEQRFTDLKEDVQYIRQRIDKALEQ